MMSECISVKEQLPERGIDTDKVILNCMIRDAAKKISENRAKIRENFIEMFIASKAVDEDSIYTIIKNMVLHEQPGDFNNPDTKFWITTDLKQKYGEWIKCSDRLPDHNEVVLIWDAKCPRPSTAFYLEGNWKEPFMGYSKSSDCNVTHWMEFPAAPEVKDE